MPVKTEPTRLNIYLDDPDLKRRVRIAAANEGVTLSAYCVRAIEERLAGESAAKARSPAAAAAELSRLRRRIGPIGIPVRDLIAEGRTK